MVQVLIALQMALSLPSPEGLGAGQELTFFPLFPFSGFETDTARWQPQPQAQPAAPWASHGIDSVPPRGGRGPSGPLSGSPGVRRTSAGCVPVSGFLCAVNCLDSGV